MLASTKHIYMIYKCALYLSIQLWTGIDPALTQRWPIWRARRQPFRHCSSQECRSGCEVWGGRKSPSL